MLISLGQEDAALASTTLKVRQQPQESSVHVALFARYRAFQGSDIISLSLSGIYLP